MEGSKYREPGDGAESVMTVTDSGYRTMSSRPDTATTRRLNTPEIYESDEERNSPDIPDRPTSTETRSMDVESKFTHLNNSQHDNRAQVDVSASTNKTVTSIKSHTEMQDLVSDEDQLQTRLINTNTKPHQEKLLPLPEEKQYSSQLDDEIIEEFADVVLLTQQEKVLLENRSKSLTAQIPYKSTFDMSMSSQQSANRRSSLYHTPSKTWEEINQEISTSRPSTSTGRKQSYADADGVQLRGDKGKARKKSQSHMSISGRSSASNSDQMPTEWMNTFKIPYTPRAQPTRLVNYQVEPPKLDKLPSIHHTSDEPEKATPKRREKTLHSSLIYHKTTATDHHIAHHPCHKLRTRHVEIHYEDYLPKGLWLEMKPKRFTKNHKHGNHFEIRKLQEAYTQQGSNSSTKRQPMPSSGKSYSVADKPKKEAFVWENPYQIWLMEKTHAAESTT